MPNGTDTIDLREAPAGQTPPPSYAAQILTVTARLLNRDLLSPINAWTLHDDITTAEAAILSDTIPEAIRIDASDRARHALPPFAGASRGEYADKLRLVARSLG